MKRPWYNKYNKTSNRKHKNSDTENGDYDKEQYKFAPFAEGKNRKTFATIKETAIAAINKEDKDLNDTCNSLKAMEIKCLRHILPIREYSVSNITEMRKAENQSLKTIFEEEIKGHVVRRRNLENGLRHAYLVLFTDWCTPSMKQKLQALPIFDTIIRHDPIALLRNIEQLMHDSIRSSYRWKRWAIPFTRVLNFKMTAGEDAVEYIKRFKQEVDNLKTVNGTRYTDYFIEAEDDYQKLTTDEEKEAMKAQAFNELMEYWAMTCTNKAQYGSINDHLASQFTMNTDQYPKSINAALEILDNHKPDSIQPKKKFKANEEETEHAVSTSFAQSQTGTSFRCYCCGKMGHTASICREAKTTKNDDWWISNQKSKSTGKFKGKKATSFQQQESNDSDDDDSVSSSTSRKSAKNNGKARAKSPGKKHNTRGKFKNAVCGFQGQVLSQLNEMGAEFDRIIGNKTFARLENTKFSGLRDVIILDKGSSIQATFNNPDFVQEIRHAKKPLKMATNSGTKILTLIGDVPDFGEVWYDPSSMANIIGFRSLAKKHKITYETNNDTFIVHMGEKTIRFVGTSQDLYVWDKTAELKKQVAKHKKMELPRERVEVTHVEVDKSHCWRNDLYLISRQSYVRSPWDLFRMELVISS